MTPEGTFEAVVLVWAGHRAADQGGDARALGARLEELCEVGVHVVVVSDAPAHEVDGWLQARPGGPGRLHLCSSHSPDVVEVTSTGPAPAVRNTPPGERHDPGAGEVRDGAAGLVWASRWLGARGITGALVLVVAVDGDPPAVPELARATVVSVEDDEAPDAVGVTGTGPTPLCRLLDAQLARRRHRRVPGIDPDPAWVMPLPGEPRAEGAVEALGALANGWAGIRGSREEGGSVPLFVVNGIYTAGPVPRLLRGPDWTRVPLADSGRGGRLLDLRTGVLARCTGGSSRVRSLRFVSAAHPHGLALRVEAVPAALGPPGDPLEAGENTAREDRPGVALARTSTPGGGGITVAARDLRDDHAGIRVVERLAAWAADPTRPPSWDAAAARLGELTEVGFDRLLAEHREAWARRWADAEVTIDGAAGDQLAARFAVFHLLGAAADQDETAVGPRGLTGPAYGGHVFWDADVHVLPALAAIRPGAARAMLEYRIRRLPAARAAATATGHRGARFPWESATDGTDVTPPHTVSHRGELIPVRTGDHEEHIVADVAWAATEYAAWSGDHGFLHGPGRDLVIDTARYWASRIRVDDHGHGHLDTVMGPDEYHEAVDDNAFTNVMARWNLRRGADLAEQSGAAGAEEITAWRDLAVRLVDGWDPQRRLYEQFRGYWDLEPLLVADVAPPPVAADALLGAERVAASQLIKQPDVVMLHHLVPGEVRPGSLSPNLAFYEPRTAHGSSLSPAIYAAIHARAGQPERALELFRLAARLDLDDLTGTTADGLHLATMGGLWQALAYGFLGLRPDGSALRLDPCLPEAWTALTMRLRFGGQRLCVHADHDTVTITCERPLQVRIAQQPLTRCPPPGCTVTLTDRRRDERSSP